MSDTELDKLKAAMKAAAPAPDAGKKAAQIALAMQAYDDDLQKNLDTRQELLSGARPTSEALQRGGLLQGVRDMYNKLTTKAGLAVTTGIVAVGLATVVIYPQMQEQGATKDTVSAVSPRGNTPQERGPGAASNAQPTAIDELAAAAPAEQAAPAPAEQMAASEAKRRTAETATTGSESGEEAQGSQAVTAEADEVMSTLDAAIPTPEPEAPRKLQEAPSETKRTMGKTAQLSPIEKALLEDIPNGLNFADVTTSSRPAPPDYTATTPEPNTEAFPDAENNPVKIVQEEPVSTFSIDVDTASYSVVRSSLERGQMPPADAVRIEEMINYFPYDYAAPEADDAAPFKPTVVVGATHWNPDTQLVTIALQGEMPLVEDRPPLNLVFLIDSSGSMDQANRLPLLKQSLRLMLPELRPEDQVAIVAYAGSSGLVLEPTPAGERAKILAALDNIGAGGSTAGAAGLQQAYQVAESMTEEGEISRVIVATDGDFNVGLSSPDAMKEFIEQKRESGTFLSVLGFGRGNLNDALMQSLAQNGNGQAAYIDTLNEARKVLVDQLTGSLFPIASDVKIQVEFNPAEVAEYRLIGYETRALKREDFNNDKVDAGEIGAGHSVTAIYEITPVGSPAVLNDPLRYGSADTSVSPSRTVASISELAFLRLRWKEPGEGNSTLLEVPITEGMGEANDETRFAAAIAGFGQLLKASQYTGNWSYADAIELANSAKGADNFGYRAEAVSLMRLAQSLSK